MAAILCITFFTKLAARSATVLNISSFSAIRGCVGGGGNPLYYLFVLRCQCLGVNVQISVPGCQCLCVGTNRSVSKCQCLCGNSRAQNLGVSDWVSMSSGQVSVS